MKAYQRLFLIDGDNHIFEGIRGIDNIAPEDKVLIFITQEGLYKRLKRYICNNVYVIQVKPGCNAVDNRIKAMLGNLIERPDRGRIYVVSRDRDYYVLIKRYRQKYGISAECLCIASSIQSVNQRFFRHG